jgi:hypothetical protein
MTSKESNIKEAIISMEETCGCWVSLLLLLLLIVFIFCQYHPWFYQILLWLIFGVLSIIIVLPILAITVSSNNQTTNTTATNTPSIVKPSSNLQDIDWQDIDWQEVNINTPIVKPSTNIQELLNNLIGAKDIVTGEVFKPGDKAYFCVPCQLGYHEESWEHLNKECDQCKSSQASIHTLPILISFTEFLINKSVSNKVE